MAELLNINQDLLARAYGPSSMASALQGGLEGFKTGTDIGMSLAERKAKQKKEELELMKEIKKLAAQQKLVKEAQTPLPTTKPGQIQTMQPVELPSGELEAPQGPAQERTAPSLLGIKRPITAEELKAEEASKQERLLGLATEAEPDERAKDIIKGDVLSGSGMREQQIQMAVIDPKTGRSRTVKGIKKMGQDGVFHPITGQKVTDVTQLPDAGYKVNTSIVGRDPNTNMPIEYNDQTGQMLSGGNPYSGVIFPRLENAPASITQAVAAYTTAKQQLTMISESYADKFVGPAMGRFKTVEEWAGTNDPEAARFMALTRTFQNAMIKAITGAQMSEPEAQRLLGQLPTFKDNPKAFISKLQVAAENADLAMKNALDAAEASGFAIKRDALSEDQVSAMLSEKFNMPKHLDASGTPIQTQRPTKTTKSGISYEVE